MHPLCVCMSTSQELCWWQMVMSAQKVLFFSGFLAVDCFLKSIFFKQGRKMYPSVLPITIPEALPWVKIVWIVGAVPYHVPPRQDCMTYQAKQWNYAHICIYIWRIHHNMTNQCENFLRFVDDESNIFLQSKFHASAALGKWNSWKLYVFIYK